MTINATLINLYNVCPRECWLHALGIQMEHTSDIVYDGKLLHETSYPQRAEKNNELKISASFQGASLTGQIDFYDPKNKIIHEIKRSDKVETAHEWQAKFYIWLLELNGIESVSALLEYPKLRHTTSVTLSTEDKARLKQMTAEIAELIQAETCPPVINAKICKRCSYYELCYIKE